MPRPTKEAIAKLTNDVMDDLGALRLVVEGTQPPAHADEALVNLETFVAVALRVFADVNPSKLKEHMRIVELQHYIPRS